MGEKDSTDTVELAGEDLQHDEGETELAQTGANIGTFECSLRCSNFHQFLRGEHYRTSAMEP